jgi:Fe-S cluster assembly iron-binding protein IscA
MNIRITAEAAGRLTEILRKEGGDAVVRIRETKIGAG